MHPNLRGRFVTVSLELPLVERRPTGDAPVTAIFPDDQASVLLQRVKALHRPVLAEVRWRGNQHALVAGEPARYPLGCLPALRRPQPDSAIEALGREIGQLLGELQLDFGAWVALLKARQCGAKPHTPKAKRGCQTNQACGL